MSQQDNLTTVINMNHFITTLFKGINCFVKEDQNYIHVQLNKEVDKAIMNRPFYWQYNESIGIEGKPATLKFSLNEENDGGEKLFIGNARFQQLHRYLKNLTKFTKMYEQIEINQNTMLHPWLLVNMIITFDGKQTKENLYSIGLNLINGHMTDNFMNILKQKKLEQTIANHCYTISPIISLSSGFKRIEQMIMKQIMESQHHWAIDSYKTLREELSLIDSLEKMEDLYHIMEKERKLTIEKLQPKINMDIFSSGIIYLKM